ncbi:putative ABC transport system permease protein [Natranaerovirga hydrolytica]|uniref:Putative ABC transport system permease protein n=1 Tax=Natranaerovirga hydrolytica TaxID=680378 RepID=A0A4R1ML80_9FIRM|nr:iron export ABC transporter permease subunit FetB [Natranaerovirga hydrolytica]TCK93265.1 putative ABC transport system permease protein [Natranaerovirga hydrolytica]
MNEIIDLEIMQLAVAYIFVIVLLTIVKYRKIDREKEILIASIRMTLQLILTGYVLSYLFDNPNPILVIAVFLLMQIFAISNILKRVKHSINPSLKKIIIFSMFIGTTITLMFFIIAIVRLSPWYDPRYFIPLAGMLVGNAMTGISLGVNHLISGMKKQRDKVEGALMLGATPKEASKPVVNEAFDSAFLPTINSMVGMGIVFLPGMMTGQILSGISPFMAIKYQIAIMLGILGSVTLTVILFVSLGYKTFFNKEYQMIEEDH